MSEEEKEKLYQKTNKLLLEQICKDVNRTHNQLDFFFKPTDETNVLSQKEKIKSLK